MPPLKDTPFPDLSVVLVPLESAVASLFVAERVVLALLLAGAFDIELVLPLIMSAVPFGSREYVVPEIVTASPGFSVVPPPKLYSVVPSRIVAE